MPTRFAAYPSAFVFETPGQKKLDHLLWGDFINVLGPEQDGWLNVRARGTTGWMRKEDIQENRLLEVNFVDIGQGDGCFIVTPDDKFLLIDAGEGDNMFRFLRWRFNLKNHPDQIITIQNAIISHPDSDHYRGFTPLFGSSQFLFENVYHNGIIERAGEDPLGSVEVIDGKRCLTDVVVDLESLKLITDDPEQVGKTWYANLLKTACESGRVSDIRMLCTEDVFLPGYDDSQKLVLRVLGPVPRVTAEGKRLLPWFSDKGKTKNGHSVVLRLEYGGVKILLGGDLNIPAEEYLLQHHTGLNPRPKSNDDTEALVNEARKTFEVDITKACHHGSADFTSIFLRAVNPIATVISSGDNESHSHPRPDALGSFGKAGRGERPLIFSTELARSAKETIKDPQVLRNEVKELILLRDKAENEEVQVRLDAKIQKLLQKIDRTVSVYGLINLRTDGTKVILAQKLEQPAPRGEWDIYRLEPNDQGQLEFASKH
jgi:beta-lactamase superfamily II metal-dependent hydrolase